MRLVHVAQKASSSTLYSSGNDAAPVSKTIPTTASSETIPACESQNTKVPLKSSPRTNLLSRVFSGSSRKTSRECSSPPESSLDHAENTPNSSTNLENMTQSVDIKGVQMSPCKRGLLRRILSLSSRHIPTDGHVEYQHANLVPPNYCRAFRFRNLPPLTFTKNEWADELVALVGNGIRAEISDMYAMFTDIEKRPTMLTLEDVELFVHWFATFLNVLGELFDLEETCLFPWVEGVDTLSHERRMWETDRGRVTGELSEARRLRKKGHLMRLGREIEKCAKLFERRPVAEGLPALAEAVDQFVSQLMEYVETKERELPGIIYRHLRLGDRSRFEKTFWTTAQNYEHHAISIVVATRWMGSWQQRKWRRRVFGVLGNRLYSNWTYLFDVSHYFVVAEFSRRVSLAQAERLAQVRENDMARARAQMESGAAEIVDYSDSEGPSAVSSNCASSAHRSRHFPGLLPAAQPFVL